MAHSVSERPGFVAYRPTMSARSDVRVMRYAYPKFIEFLHTVRYIDKAILKMKRAGCGCKPRKSIAFAWGATVR